MDKGYSDTKICKCISCGVDVEVTKFASAAKTQCQSCKSNGAKPNESVISTIPAKSKHDIISGDTKPSKCTKCGADTQIGKFASHKTALCDTCKGDSPSTKSSGIVPRLTVDISKIDYSKLPSLDDHYILPTVLKNPRLRQVKCPACGKEFMKIIKILDYSDHGAVVTYQCTDCYSSLTLSEQPQTLMVPIEYGDYDYSGETMETLLSKLQETQLKHTMRAMKQLLDKNNIPFEGFVRPRIVRKIDEIVPRGLNTAINTESVTLAELIDTLSLIKKFNYKAPSAIKVSTALINRLRQYHIVDKFSDLPDMITGVPIVHDDSLGADEWRVEYEDTTTGYKDN